MYNWRELSKFGLFQILERLESVPHLTVQFSLCFEAIFMIRQSRQSQNIPSVPPLGVHDPNGATAGDARELVQITDDTSQIEPLETRDVETEKERQPTVTGVRKAVYLFLAGFFFVLAALGAILPILPTTPFLLLTSFLLMRSSPKLNSALLRSPLMGPILLDWQKRGGIRSSVKIQAVLIVATAVSLTFFFSPLADYAKAALVLLGLVGIGVILRVPTLPSDSE